MSGRLTRSAVKKNPKLLEHSNEFSGIPVKTPRTAKKSAKKTSAKKTSAKKSSAKKRVNKKLDLSDKENSSPNKTPKRSRKKATPKKDSAKKTTPKKKATPKKDSAKKTTPKRSTKKSTKKKTTPKKESAKKTTPKSSGKKAKRSTKKTTPKSSTKKAKASPKKSPKARKSPKAAALSDKVKELTKKIDSDAVTDNDLENMFSTKALEKLAATEEEDDDYVLIDKNVDSEDMHAKVAPAEEAAHTGDSSDLTIMTMCSLLAYAVANYMPSFIEGKLPKIWDLENPTTFACACISSILFAVGFHFAAKWSRSREHAVQVYRVSFGLATVLVGGYLLTCCEQKFRVVLTTAALGFALFELVHLWDVETIGGYFRIAITFMIAFWSLMLSSSSEKGNDALIEYNTYILLVFTVGNILVATEAIHTHFTVGTYMVATLSVYIWAIQNGKIPTADIQTPIKMGILTFVPVLLALLDELKPKQ